MRKIYVLLRCLLLWGAATPLAAQSYEAENAVLTGGAAKVACPGCSGGFAVAQGEGNLLFRITIPREGFYHLSIRVASPSGDKTNTLEVAGNTLSFKTAQNGSYTTLRLVSGLKLAPGGHDVKITKSWGWINLDYLEVAGGDGAGRFSLNQALVTPHPTPEAKALYDFLLDHYGNKIIAGVMTLSSLDEVNWLKTHTGKEPALLGLDFMHSGRNYAWYNDKEPIRDARDWYGRNGIPTLLWHWRDPSRRTEEFYARNASRPAGTDFDVSRIADPASPESRAMLADIDYVAGLLKELQDQGVPVLWRPLHEAAGGWFWWGAKGPAPLKALWHLLYDRLVYHHGLRNLVWVWTREPNDEEWYPGDAYVDIVGRDLYKDGDHGSQALEFSSMNGQYGGKKMLALSETGSFPDVDHLVKDGAAWSWFMPWYGKYTREATYNPLALWQKLFAHDYVITLDEMPALRGYVRREPAAPVAGLNPRGRTPSLRVYPTVVRDALRVEHNRPLGSLAVYNALGGCVRRQRVRENGATLSFAGLPPGLYVVVADQALPVKVWKE